MCVCVCVGVWMGAYVRACVFYRRNGRGDSPPPSQYVVTNHAKERPDVWVTDPTK